MIFASEDGFDIRFSKPGLYGYGNYFSNTSQYSHQYAHSLGDGVY